MTEPQSTEEFEHLHKDAMLGLDDELLNLRIMKTESLAPLDKELTGTLTALLQKLPRTGRIDPEEVFRKTISSLPALEAQRFLIENVLEASKRGETLDTVLKRYSALGLLSEDLPSNIDVSTTNLGKELQKRKSLWGRVVTRFIQVGVNALKSIPKWIEIEPIITVVPPALSFALKGKGMTLHDLIETLREETN